MIDKLRAQALAAWEQIHPQRAKPSDLNYLVQSRDYILVFWFVEGDKSQQPALISKIPRIKKFNHYIERSVRLVDNLRSTLKPPLLETLPLRVFAGRVNDLAHIVMGTMPGEPIIIPANNFLGRRAVEQHLSAYLSWLIEFQTQSLTGFQNYDWGRFFQEQHSKAELQFLRSGKFPQFSREFINRLPPTDIPFTWGYGDAHHSNILMQQDQISGVIDWIGVEENQWFYTDWYYFLFFYGLEFFKKNVNIDLDSQRRLAISTTLGVGDHWLTGLFRDKTRQFLKNYSFDPHLSPELFITFLYDLHWPQGKASLIKDAYQIYRSKHPQLD